MEHAMPRVEWALLCDLAYFDAYRNLCVIGVQTQPVPTFPAGTRRFAIAARVPGLTPRPSVTVALSTPDSVASVPIECERVHAEAVGDYLLVTIGVAPLVDDGIYRFEVALASQPPISIDLPIVVAGQSTQARVQSDRSRDQTAGAGLPRRGRDHV
jgi:hypothetical protein